MKIKRNLITLQFHQQFITLSISKTTAYYKLCLKYHFMYKLWKWTYLELNIYNIYLMNSIISINKYRPWACFTNDQARTFDLSYNLSQKFVLRVFHKESK